MALAPRVFNLSRKFWMKHTRALRSVDECACAWVEFGVSVRDLTLAESITARSQQTKAKEPLPFAELPSCLYQPSDRGQALTRAGYQQIRAANQFAAMQ